MLPINLARLVFNLRLPLSASGLNSLDRAAT
jgi:hypothetical protein